MSEMVRTPQIYVTFQRMGELEFILQGGHFPVKKLPGLQSCDALAHDPQKNQLFVQSNVTADVLRLFISAVHGSAIELTNENIEGLSALCDEFRFGSLSRRLDAFQKTPPYRFEQRFNGLRAKFQSLEDRMDQHGHEIGGARIIRAKNSNRR
jgi:hypothetical protein